MSCSNLCTRFLFNSSRGKEERWENGGKEFAVCNLKTGANFGLPISVGVRKFISALETFKVEKVSVFSRLTDLTRFPDFRKRSREQQDLLLRIAFLSPRVARVFHAFPSPELSVPGRVHFRSLSSRFEKQVRNDGSIERNIELSRRRGASTLVRLSIRNSRNFVDPDFSFFSSDSE